MGNKVSKSKRLVGEPISRQILKPVISIDFNTDLNLDHQ